MNDNLTPRPVTALPEPVQLTNSEVKALREMQADTEAYQRFIEHITNQARLKMRKIQEQGAETYRAISKRTGIDTTSIQWAPDLESGILYPIQLQLPIPRP